MFCSFTLILIILDTEYLLNTALPVWLCLTDFSVLEGTTSQTIIPAGIFCILLRHLNVITRTNFLSNQKDYKMLKQTKYWPDTQKGLCDTDQKIPQGKLSLLHKAGFHLNFNVPTIALSCSVRSATQRKPGHITH